MTSPEWLAGWLVGLVWWQVLVTLTHLQLMCVQYSNLYGLHISMYSLAFSMAYTQFSILYGLHISMYSLAFSMEHVQYSNL